MKSKFIGLFSALFVAFIAVISVGAISLNSIDYNSVPPKAVLYDDDRISSTASFDSTDFTTTKGSGNTIKIWYDNKENSSVKITLYKYGLFGTKDDVLVFKVSGNDNKYKEYTANKADSARYYINIEASYGDNITGYLRATQIS